MSFCVNTYVVCANRRRCHHRVVDYSDDQLVVSVVLVV